MDQQTKKHKKTLKRATISGSTEGRERDDIVAAYNAGNKTDALSLTDAAREGIDLMGTGTMHVMESAQNLHSENQTMSRVARFGSHAKLPADQQKVVFVKYHSVFPSAAALEKQRKELEDYFDKKYKLKAHGEFDIVAALVRLFKQLENGETVDERYARTNLEKAKLLTPWLDLLKRVGDRKAAVVAAVKRLEAAGIATSAGGSGGKGGKKKRKTLTLEELAEIRKSLVIAKADPTPLPPSSSKKKRKREEGEVDGGEEAKKSKT
jgi:hypothetical protein